MSEVSLRPHGVSFCSDWAATKGLQGYLAHKKQRPTLGPYSRTI